jgi:hypothetical protein
MSRRNRRILLDLYINKLVNGVPFMVRTANLSKGGLFVHRLIEPTPPKDAHIAIEFALPGTKEVLWAEADISHRGEDGGMGLEFRDLTPRVARLINEFVDDSSGLHPIPIGI